MYWILPCCTSRISSNLLFNSYNVAMSPECAMGAIQERKFFEGERACATRVGSDAGAHYGISSAFQDYRAASWRDESGCIRLRHHRRSVIECIVIECTGVSVRPSRLLLLVSHVPPEVGSLAWFVRSHSGACAPSRQLLPSVSYSSGIKVLIGGLSSQVLLQWDPNTTASLRPSLWRRPSH
jgi:hypothetical protein